MKKVLSLVLCSSILLTSCGLFKNKNKEEKKEKIDISMFEKNDAKRSKYKGYTIEEVYINGKKVKIDVQQHGDHYHIIYNEKKYSLDKDKYKELFKKDNKITLMELKEKKLSEINTNDIISYEKHGDHWHVKTKYGEFITYEDPSKFKNINDVRSNSIRTISGYEARQLNILRYYRHGDHWHIVTVDGSEYISYENPEGRSNITQIQNRIKSEVIKDTKLFEKVVNHGDHYHVWFDGKEYVLSKSEYELAIRENKFTPNKETPRVIEEEDTKDNDVDIVEITKHGDHWHIKTSDGKEYITYENPEGKKKLSEIKNKKESTEVKSDLFEKVVQHDDHYHVWYKGREYIISEEEYEKAIKEHRFTPNVSDNENNNSQELTKEQMEKLAKDKIDKIIDRYKLSESEIKKIKVDIENNVIVYPHGSHYHYEPIDETKPYNINGKKQPPLVLKRNPEIENLKVIGPYPINIIKNNFDKEAFIAKNNIKGIKNKDNFNIVAFTSSNKDVQLKVNNDFSENWGYLVLHGLNEKTILENIKAPELIIPDELYFKEWIGHLPEVAGRDIIMTARFGKVKYKNSPIVLGPSKNNVLPENPEDYHIVLFSSFYGGYFKFGNQTGGNFRYLVKEKATWGEMLKNGLIIPEVIPYEGYEFIEWGAVGQDGVNNPNTIPENLTLDKSGVLVLVPRFGVTDINLGDYIPENQDNPLDPNDKNIPNPRDPHMPYNENNYVKIAFSGGNHGKIYNFFGEHSKSSVFLVRKGLTLRQAMVYAPSIVDDEGYKQKGWDNIVNMDEVITEDKLYTMEYSETKEKENSAEIPNTVNSNEIKDEVTKDIIDNKISDGLTEEKEFIIPDENKENPKKEANKDNEGENENIEKSDEVNPEENDVNIPKKEDKIDISDKELEMINKESDKNSLPVKIN